MDAQQYCLKWNNFSQHLKYAFNSLWGSDSTFTDVIVSAQGGFKMRAHKMVLSACSYFFKKLLVVETCETPLLVLHDVTRTELEALMHYMYHGEVNVGQDVIPGLLKAAEMLQIRGLCAVSPQTESSGAASSRAAKRPAADSITSTASAKKARRRPAPTTSPSVAAPAPPPAAAVPLPPPPPLQQQQQRDAPAGVGGATSAPGTNNKGSGDAQEGRDTNGVGSPADSDDEGQLQIDETSNGLEPETMLDEQDGDNDEWSMASGEEQFFPLPRSDDPAPDTYTATARLKNLAVKMKSGPRLPNDLEAAIMNSLPRNENGGSGRGSEQTATVEERYLAFHEPRPCPHCQRMYRDASTLRTHVAIMHTEAQEPFTCTCGAIFRTKYEMYMHRKTHR